MDYYMIRIGQAWSQNQENKTLVLFFIFLPCRSSELDVIPEKQKTAERRFS